MRLPCKSSLSQWNVCLASFCQPSRNPKTRPQYHDAPPLQGFVTAVHFHRTSCSHQQHKPCCAHSRTCGLSEVQVKKLCIASNCHAFALVGTARTTSNAMEAKSPSLSTSTAQQWCSLCHNSKLSADDKHMHVAFCAVHATTN